MLADRWVFVRDGHDDLRVSIAEVNAHRVVVGVDAYNVGIRHADRWAPRSRSRRDATAAWRPSAEGVPVPTGESLRLA